LAEADRRKWDGKYAEGQWTATEAPAWARAFVHELPGRPATALDLASGAGRIALWLAELGYATTALDISERGLAHARERAAQRGLALATACLDLEEEPWPEAAFAVVTCFNFRLLNASWAAVRARLAPGGVLMTEAATQRNLELHDRPPKHFLLAPNELLEAARGLHVIHYQETWIDPATGAPTAASPDARHKARLVARRA
jgi:SAM-dependent methyltransferase